MNTLGLIGWLPSRQRVAGSAILLAVLTSGAIASAAPVTWAPTTAFAYIVAAIVALFWPPAILGQVVVGQYAVVRMIETGGELSIVYVIATVAAIVATAELLGIAARLEMPIERSPRRDLGRGAVSTLLGTAVFLTVLAASGLTGPSGLAATFLAAGTLAGLALVLERAVKST